MVAIATMSCSFKTRIAFSRLQADGGFSFPAKLFNDRGEAPTMSSSALTSLAILKVNWDRLGLDYVENFVPFVVECARSSSEEVISLPTMQQMVSDKFGLPPEQSIRS